MINEALGGLISEVKLHPWTTLSALVAVAGMAIMFPGRLDASKLQAQVATVEGRLDNLATEVRIAQALNTQRALEQEIRQLDQATFDLESRIRDQERRSIQVDALYYERLRELTQSKVEAERRLSDFIRAHPELADRQ